MKVTQGGQSGRRVAAAVARANAPSGLASQSVVSVGRMVGVRQSNPEVYPWTVGLLRRWESPERWSGYQSSVLIVRIP